MATKGVARFYFNTTAEKRASIAEVLPKKVSSVPVAAEVAWNIGQVHMFMIIVMMTLSDRLL